jgi:hypothetical protein
MTRKGLGLPVSECFQRRAAREVLLRQERDYYREQFIALALSHPNMRLQGLVGSDKAARREWVEVVLAAGWKQERMRLQDLTADPTEEEG